MISFCFITKAFEGIICSKKYDIDLKSQSWFRKLNYFHQKSAILTFEVVQFKENVCFAKGYAISPDNCSNSDLPKHLAFSTTWNFYNSIFYTWPFECCGGLRESLVWSVEPQIRSTCPWWTPQHWRDPALPPSPRWCPSQGSPWWSSGSSRGLTPKTYYKNIQFEVKLNYSINLPDFPSWPAGRR